MRLSPSEIDAIRDAVADLFGAQSVVRLFGSRTDDARRGGDIDLLVEIDGAEPGYLLRSRFHDRVEAATDHKKIDLAFWSRQQAPSPFTRIALRDGIVL